MRLATLCISLLLACSLTACRSDGKGTGPPVPASSDPEGKDLKEGAIVVALETTSKGYRIYKVKEVKFFPPPMSDELVMIAFSETGNDFKHASDLWRQRDLTVAVASVRVQRHLFIKRDYRVLEYEPVTDVDKKLTPEQKFPQRP
jgi:hypothetical protein